MRLKCDDVSYFSWSYCARYLDTGGNVACEVRLSPISRSEKAGACYFLGRSNGSNASWLQRRSEGPQYATLGVWFESVAQLVEHRPFKALVLGSSPSALTINSL